uniref:carboxymuconolactone decarboxylase family protein n=1 Tax=Caballeronia sp. LjRoot34 TaxID=3342325 RepID=UPI003F4FF00B
MGKLGHAISGPFAGFAHLHRMAIASDAIPTKHKELIALGIVIAQQCDDCIGRYHGCTGLHLYPCSLVEACGSRPAISLRLCL